MSLQRYQHLTLTHLKDLQTVSLPQLRNVLRTGGVARGISEDVPYGISKDLPRGITKAGDIPRGEGYSAG